MEIANIIAIVAPAAALVFGAVSLRRGQRADDSTSAREMGQLLTEVGYIKSSLDALTRKLDGVEARYTALSERLAKVEAAAASAHKRIDEFEGR